MNKLFLLFGFILLLPFYFHDGAAEWIQGIGGNVWVLFSSFGVFLYPVYLAIFFLPIFLIISFFIKRFKHELVIKEIFLKLFYGFILSSVFFIVFALIAISQFRFTQ